MWFGLGVIGPEKEGEDTRVADFKGRHFAGEVIPWAVRWHLIFPVSYRDLELMLADRGIQVDRRTIFRWIQAHAGELKKRLRPHLCSCKGSWQVDETHISVNGRWTYLYRAVDGRGQTNDFPLSVRRDKQRRNGSSARRWASRTRRRPSTFDTYDALASGISAYCFPRVRQPKHAITKVLRTCTSMLPVRSGLRLKPIGHEGSHLSRVSEPTFLHAYNFSHRGNALELPSGNLTDAWYIQEYLKVNNYAKT